MEHDCLTFSNPNLAAFFHLHNIPIEYRLIDGFVIITVIKTSETLELKTRFERNEKVPILDYVTALQEIRHQMNDTKRRARL